MQTHRMMFALSIAVWKIVHVERCRENLLSAGIMGIFHSCRNIYLAWRFSFRRRSFQQVEQEFFFSFSLSENFQINFFHTITTDSIGSASNIFNSFLFELLNNFSNYFFFLTQELIFKRYKFIPKINYKLLYKIIQFDTFFNKVSYIHVYSTFENKVKINPESRLKYALTHGRGSLCKFKS